MDVQTIDQQYQQLQTQAQELSKLAGKLKAVAQTGNQDAREWMLDPRHGIQVSAPGDRQGVDGASPLR